MLEIFTVQLFRSPPEGSIVDFALCYEWIFTCQLQTVYNVTAGPVGSFSKYVEYTNGSCYPPKNEPNFLFKSLIF